MIYKSPNNQLQWNRSLRSLSIELGRYLRHEVA